MTTSTMRAGLTPGSLIAIVFGLIFIEVNSGGLAAPWPLVIRIAGAVIAAALLVETFRLPRPERPAQGNWVGDRRYWIVVTIEAVALFGGLYVLTSSPRLEPGDSSPR